MNRMWKRAGVGVAAVSAALLVGAPAGAAAPAEAQAADMFCLVQPGKAVQCTSTEAAMRELAPAAPMSHVLNLWEHPEYQGARMEVWKGQAPGETTSDCSGESNFNPPDRNLPILELNGVARWVSSVRKIDTGHCNWMLEGPNGYRSTEVENDWPRLGTLGNGWDNRAVRVLID